VIAFLYARVSTDRKMTATKRRQEVENQLREMRAFAKEKNWQIGREFIDRITGTGKKRREQLDEMMAACARREQGVQIVLIWALDRLTREGPLKTLLMVNRLESSKIRVKSLKEPWLDPDSPLYELLLPIFAWIAKQESLRRGERVRAGMERAKEKGKRFGRPRADANPRQIASLRASGHSLRAIARQLGISEGTVRRSLRKRA